MLEAVGEQYWQEYFSSIASNLVKGGEALLQVITIPDDIFAAYRKNVDFIQKYIFFLVACQYHLREFLNTVR